MLVSDFILRLAPVIVCMTGNLMAQTPDATEDIRGPKQLIIVPKTLVQRIQETVSPTNVWLYVVGVLIILAIVGILFWRNYRKRFENGYAKLALSSLAELENSLDDMPAEAFAYLATRTVRQYIADRFGLAAPYRTTEEFFRKIEQNGTETIIAESDHLKAFLKSCDLAKFAGSHLDATQRGELLRAARAFITATASNLNIVKP